MRGRGNISAALLIPPRGHCLALALASPTSGLVLLLVPGSFLRHTSRYFLRSSRCWSWVGPWHRWCLRTPTRLHSADLLRAPLRVQEQAPRSKELVEPPTYSCVHRPAQVRAGLAQKLVTSVQGRVQADESRRHRGSNQFFFRSTYLCMYVCMYGYALCGVVCPGAPANFMH